MVEHHLANGSFFPCLAQENGSFHRPHILLWKHMLELVDLDYVTLFYREAPDIFYTYVPERIV
jgi:hypothetical protein